MLHFRVASYPYLASAFTGSLVIYLWSRPGVRSLAATLLLGAGFAGIYGGFGSPAFLGLGSLANLGLTTVWSPRQRQAQLDTCLTASLFPLFLIAAAFSLAMTGIAYPKTYDLFLYAFDEQLGGQPSFLAGRFLAHCAALRQLCIFGYEALPLAMAMAFVLERSRPRRPVSSIMLAFVVSAAGGFLSYNFYPAVGPVHVFGERFPYLPPVSGAYPLHLIAAGEAPRNAMPSVHIAMALLILWHARGGPRLWQGAAAALMAITMLATLGFGEHYLADLFVAAPFAMLAQGVAASGVPWRNGRRSACVAGGILAVVGWLAYLRQPSPPLAGRGILAWILLATTAGGALVLESRLSRAGLVNKGEYPDRLHPSG
jgi:hypothetical protein